MNDCSWGTRQAKKVQTGKKKTFWQRLCGKSDEEIEKESDEDLEGSNCTCVLCLDSRYEVVMKKEVLDMINRKHTLDEEPITEEPKKVEPIVYKQEPPKDTRKTDMMRKSVQFNNDRMTGKDIQKRLFIFREYQGSAN